MATKAQQQRPVHVERGTGAEDLEEEVPGTANAGGGEEATPGGTTVRQPTGMSTPKGGRKDNPAAEVETQVTILMTTFPMKTRA